MDDVSEDLAILYRAVARRRGLTVYAGCVTAPEAFRLVQMGVARLVDVREDGSDGEGREPAALPEAAALPGAAALWMPRATSGSPVHDLGEALRRIAAPTDTLLFISAASGVSHEAATLAARAGFCCVLNVLDGRERYRAGCT